jgi:CheY-like chemotaxis protein
MISKRGVCEHTLSTDRGATGMGEMYAFVLIVEDDEDIQTAMKAILELEGYSVQVANHGGQALEILERDTRPCLILLDLRMPVMNGQELSRRLKSDPHLATHPVVIVSADAQLEQTAVQLQANGHLRKPLEMFALLELVRSYCGPASAPLPELPGFPPVRT